MYVCLYMHVWVHMCIYYFIYDICMYVLVCVCIDSYMFVCVLKYADTYNNFQYVQIHTIYVDTYTYIHIHTHTYTYIHTHKCADANTDTYKYKQYRRIQAHMYRYIQFADTYTYRQIHTYTCIYMQIQDMNTYAFLVLFICACIVHVYTSNIHANIKRRFNMNTDRQTDKLALLKSQ